MYLSAGQLFPFYFGALLLLFSIILFRQEKTNKALWLLFSGAIIIGFGMARLDPFLCLWDEQYHALVAKNMIAYPFKPMLYADPLFGYDISNWTANHIWLHKPPLFLWPIALSVKLFGTNALAVRLPSVVLHGLTALLVYRIGNRTVNATAGFYGALFFTCAYYPLELMAGKYATDHNDTSFLFYVTASIIAWMEFEATGKRRWWILTGVLAGCAVLVKWLAGLLVYGCWFMAVGADDRKQWRSIGNYKPFLSALAVTLAVTAPWYLYTFSRYPEEAKIAFSAHAQHLLIAVEGHG
ncbi:MAG: ArnT family glycosyltransferase, partial [Bacteroidota bacterium]